MPAMRGEILLQARVLPVRGGMPLLTTFEMSSSRDLIGLGIKELGGRPVEERVVVTHRKDWKQVMSEQEDKDFKA